MKVRDLSCLSADDFMPNSSAYIEEVNTPPKNSLDRVAIHHDRHNIAYGITISNKREKNGAYRNMVEDIDQISYRKNT